MLTRSINHLTIALIGAAVLGAGCQSSNQQPALGGGFAGVGVGGTTGASGAGAGAAGFGAQAGTTSLGGAGSAGLGTAGTGSAGTSAVDAAVNGLPDGGTAGSSAGTGGAGGNDAAVGGGNDAGMQPCPAAPASASPQAVAALAAVNKVRVAAGAGCANMVQAINDSARKHCEYYAGNAGNQMCIANAHVEVAGCTGFVAAQFGDRMKAAGYNGGSFEVMAFLNDPQKAVDTWINSVWHRLPMLNPWYTDLGYGNATKCDTIDFGRGTPMPDSTIVVYPYNGQVGVPPSFNGQYEGPMPPAPSSGWPSGQPITVYAKQISVSTHVLTKDGDTTPLAHIFLTSADSSFLRDDIMMYAEKPLLAATKYRVQITGTSISGPLNLDWTFTTR